MTKDISIMGEEEPQLPESQQTHNGSSSAQASASSHPTHEQVSINIPKMEPLSSSKSTQAFFAEGLEGKYVDEFGNILDWYGTVLGRAEGDLPSMVGRPVTATGEIFDEEGAVAGHVSENTAQEEAKRSEAARKPVLRPLAGALKTDSEGNIYNGDGEPIGKLNEGMLEKEEQKLKAPAGLPTPSPSEVYLDVKSTHDGIQLIIKIPTVFSRDPKT